jgi:hypothetical protein
VGGVLDVGVYGSNPNLVTNNANQNKIDIQSKHITFPTKILIELSQNEDDERYRYLLKNGIVRRVEDDDKIIFAELP